MEKMHLGTIFFLMSEAGGSQQDGNQLLASANDGGITTSTSCHGFQVGLGYTVSRAWKSPAFAKGLLGFNCRLLTVTGATQHICLHGVGFFIQHFIRPSTVWAYRW